MTTLMRAQVVIPYFTNLPEDVMTNTLYFVSDDVTPYEAAADYLTGRLSDFYESIYASTRMGQYVNPGAAVVKWYDMGDPEPRVPYEVPLGASITKNAGSQIPTEVAIVLSFHGAHGTTPPPASRRGRIYLGGWATTAMTDAAADQYPRVNSTLVTAIGNAAEQYLLDTGDAGLKWHVYSPTHNVSFEVIGGWVDNSPDTQRRRSVDATSRTLWP